MATMIRMPKHQIQYAAENGFVAIGWSYIDLSSCLSGDEALAEVLKVHPDISSRRAGAWRGRFREFFDLRQGDIVVIPTWGGVYFAQVASNDFVYDPKEQDKDLSNQIKVKYLSNPDGTAKYIRRTEFCGAFQRRMRSQGAVLSLDMFEEEIQSIFQGETKDSLWEQSVLAHRQDMEKSLLKAIRDGRTHINEGGLGLECLVRDILTCEGYIVDILPKNRHSQGADVDLIAFKEDNFLGNQSILIQAKHHSGNSGKKMYEQLINAVDESEGEYDESKLLVVTTGAIEESLRTKYEADERFLSSIDGRRFVEILIDKLKDLEDMHQRGVISTDWSKALGVLVGPCFPIS